MLNCTEIKQSKYTFIFLQQIIGSLVYFQWKNNSVTISRGKWMAVFVNDITTFFHSALMEHTCTPFWWRICCPRQVHRGPLCLVGLSPQMKADAIISVKFPVKGTGWCMARTVVNYQCNQYSSNTATQDEGKKKMGRVNKAIICR